MTDLLSSLNSIEASLERLSRPTAALLKQGVAAATIQPMLADRGLAAPGDLLRLWEWRGGTDAPEGVTLGDIWLVPGFYLLSAEEAVRRFDHQLADSRWSRSWLPVLADDGGDYLAVQCTVGDDHGAVYRFRYDDYEFPMEYGGIERMAATYAAAYERGAFFVDADGWLQQDDHAFVTLAALLNPDVAWWRDS